MRGKDIETRFTELHQQLAASDAFEPLEFGGPDERLWADCDLASLAENRLGDSTDPRVLDDERRSDWLTRATRDAPWPPEKRAPYERPYWLREDGRRVGTVAVTTSELGNVSARISSLYIFPDARGAGGRALRRLREMVHAQGIGVRLETCWSWQRAVRFYLREGLWVRMWKRDLELCCYPDEPAPILAIGDTRATLSVELPEGRRVVLEEAARDGNSLVFIDTPAPGRDDEALREVRWHAMPTLSVAIALAGWPLVRSREEWEASYWADSGPPEALAYKITIWEALERKRGWRVDTVPIPGLVYPTWAEHEARWEEKAREMRGPKT